MSRALGRYELVRPLARGGMAEVYLARRRAAGVEKWLVVKRIRAAFATDVRFLDLFVREARLSMSLAHQNIVPVFDFGRIDDQVFLAMERIEGKDLGTSLERAASPLPPLLAAFIASECCQALDYAHHRKSTEGTALGIVHRDVTPRNVLLSWSGEVKLTDFGIAALAGDATSKLVGTPAYMAPEQARAEPIDARADLYALGLVLREVLTGDRARPGTDRIAMHQAAITGALVPWRAGLPSAIVAIVDRATAVSPDDRFPDARSMLAELDDFMVAERAANKSEAPARSLSAWLSALWIGDTEDRGIDGDVAGDHLVSFLDDGPLDVLGTGTQRSQLATAGDDEAPPRHTKTVRAGEDALAATAVANDAERTPATAGTRAAQGIGGSTTSGATTAPIGGRRAATWLAPMLIAITAIAAIGVFKLRSGEGPTEPTAGPAIAAGATADAARSDSGTEPTVIEPGRAPPPVDAAPAKTNTAATSTPSTNPTSKPSTTPTSLTAPTKIQTGSAAPPPGAPLRKVTINVTPGWAYFTVDGDPTSHETIKTLSLAAGKHTIQFSSPALKIERTVTIEVPEDRDLNHVERLGN